MKWTKRQFDTGIRHFGELFRECGMLWLVFSLLDRLVSDTLTFRWAIPNAAAAFLLWIVGTYVDMKREVTA